MYFPYFAGNPLCSSSPLPISGRMNLLDKNVSRFSTSSIQLKALSERNENNIFWQRKSWISHGYINKKIKEIQLIFLSIFGASLLCSECFSTDSLLEAVTIVSNSIGRYAQWELDNLLIEGYDFLIQFGNYH